MGKKCFVICPISEAGSDTRKRSDQLLKHILSPVCKQCDLDEPERVDLLPNPKSITTAIIEHLTNDDLVFADITDENPNVFYELGFRTALNKPLIQLKASGCSIPFDVANTNTFSYNLSDPDDIESTVEKLAKTVSAFNFDEGQNSAENNPAMLNATILQVLYSIQEQLKTIESQTNQIDTKVISVLVDKLSSSKAKSDNQVIMETLIPLLVREPEKVVDLMNAVEQVNTSKG